jgi:phosphatidate cytidylyltransferase
MVAPEEASPSKGKVFAQRLGSTTFLYGVLMIGLFSSSRQLSLIAFGGIITLLGVLALMELYGMAEKRGLKPFRGLGIAIGVALTGSAFWALGIHGQPDLALDIEIASLLCAVPVLGVAQIRRYTNEDKSSLAPLAATVFGIIYVAMLLNVLQKIRYFPDLEGHWWLMFFIVVSKMSDTGAYCTGQLIGRTKMIPRVSPGKTWEGFAGGIAFSVLAAWMFLHIAGKHFGAMPLMHALILGLVLGVGSVLGDLVESLFKRESDMKDSGSFFPGVGGILDILDSLLFNAPLMYLYLKYILPS